MSRAVTPAGKQSDALNMIYSYFSHVVNGVRSLHASSMHSLKSGSWFLYVYIKYIQSGSRICLYGSWT